MGEAYPGDKSGAARPGSKAAPGKGKGKGASKGKGKGK